MDRGRGHREPDAGEHLPFWVQDGDFFQLPPVLDTTLLTFQLFMQDVVVLDEVKRQDESERGLLSLAAGMRDGATAEEWKAHHEYTKTREIGSLSPHERELFTLPALGTLLSTVVPSATRKHRTHDTQTRTQQTA